MAQVIKLRTSSIASSTPVVGDIILGELAINTYDGKLFLKKNDGTEAIVEVGYNATTLNNQIASYYLDWGNVTNKPTIESTIIDSNTNAVESNAIFDALALKEGNLGFTPEDAADKGVASGYVPLDGDTKIATTYLPALAITDTHVAANEAGQLALTVQKGDVCVRTDENKSYIALNSDNADMGDWQELLTPTDAVISVNTLTGAVTLVTGDINEGAGEGTINLWYTDARVLSYVGGTKNDSGTGTGDLWSASKINTYVAAAVDDGSAHVDTVDPDADDDDSSGFYVGQVWVNTTDNGSFICVDATDSTAIWNELSTSAGTITGGANVGASGVGVYSAVNGSNLEFNKIDAGSTKIGVSLASNVIDIDVNESNVDHDNLLNFTATEHFTQASITTVGTITTGTWNGTTIAIANGGTGATTAGGARTALGVDAAGTDNSTDVTVNDSSSIDFTASGTNDQTITAVVLPGGVDHDSLLNYVVGQHRIINDSATTSTIELFSANQITTRTIDGGTY